MNDSQWEDYHSGRLKMSSANWTHMRQSILKAICAGVLLLGGCALQPATPPPAPMLPRAIRVERPIVPPDVPMLDQNGRTATLSDLRGKYVFAFFSNIECQEDCVDGVPMFQQVKARLGRRDDLMYVMVGTDHDADAPAALQAYLSKADPSFIGLTAEQPAMREFAVRFGIHTYLRKDGALAPHAPFMYLLDKKGQLVYFFQRGLSADQIAETIERVIAEQ
jgi:cytochrome oxidase Cu insertion factor (SCO1/SenC/PrrC family)